MKTAISGDIHEHSHHRAHRQLLSSLQRNDEVPDGTRIVCVFNRDIADAQLVLERSPPKTFHAGTPEQSEATGATTVDLCMVLFLSCLTESLQHISTHSCASQEPRSASIFRTFLRQGKQNLFVAVSPTQV
ncbi:unnamed protein product [Amoebophrya sp. A120]|nr:unnamed protein product [Amoebophrya sp. A120]|eukprot:GSA120T00025133001.1